ncbi:MAG: ABC transporter permease [Clostridia bacterium]|nr:ABC transporter permease [Clostridia bacterium]
MLKFIFRKIINKKWLFLALLIGNILLTAITCSNPLYSDAVMQRMLDDDLEQYIEDKNYYPGTISVVYTGAQKRNGLVEELEALAREIPVKMGVPTINETTHIFLSLAGNKALVDRSDAYNSSMSIGMLSNLEDHAKITAGRMYSDTPQEDGTIEVIASQQGLIQLNLLMGENRQFTKLVNFEGKPLVIEVVGVFDVADPSDIYWARTPSSLRNEVLMDENLFRALFMKEDAPLSVNATWYEQLDTSMMRSKEAEHVYDTMLHYKEIAGGLSYLNITSNFEALYKEHLSMRLKVSVTLWVLQVPIYILLAAFIFMVSRQILETEASEISVLKSRGVKNSQIVGIYLIQSFLLAVVSLMAGLPLGIFITQVLGSANAFLEFVSRQALPVEMSPKALLYAGCAAFVAICAMVLPVRKYARTSIVHQKQKKNRRVRPFWQKAFLDVIALGVSLYGLNSFNRQKEMFAQRIVAGEIPDPLLFLCSSLFIIGAGLLAIRIIPILLTVVFSVFKRL